MRLTDGVVVLRPPSEADVARMVEAASDPDFDRFLNPPEVVTEEAMRQIVAEALAAPEGRCELAIADAETDESLGFVALTVRRHEIADIGYGVHPAARGRGVATRAVRLMCDWAFAELGVGRIELRALPDNVASLKVAANCGFVREGIARSAWTRRGRRYDTVVHSLLPSDPR